MFLKKIYWLIGNLLFFYPTLFLSTCLSQQEVVKKDQYQIGPDERLLITVHIFGEVRIPGEYLVPDDSNILELISKAGGPTEFSNLSNVRITRGLTGISNVTKNFKKSESTYNKKIPFKKYNKQVIKIDLKRLLDDEKYHTTLPTLQPGDIIRVSRNAWFTWQAVIRLISQVAIVVQLWYWYSRIE